MSRYQCKHCPAYTYSSRDAAFMLGWRIWSGTTVGGEQREDIVCPKCAGTVPERAEAEPGWGVRCRTCDWLFEDEYNEGPLSAKEAKEMAHDHECEPDVQIQSPSDGDWHDPWRVNDDGTLKERPKVGAR